MVSGIWDAVGLLLAASRGMLAGVPGILAILHRKLVGSLPLDAAPQSVGEFIHNIWLEWLGVWLLYYFLVVAGGGFLLWVRRHKTVLYNVGPQQSELGFAHVLTPLGLEQSPSRTDIYLRSSRAFE